LEAVPYSWPAIALLYIIYTPPPSSKVSSNNENSADLKQQRLFCSGTLINRDTILTASHCILDATFTEFPIELSSVNPTYESMYRIVLGAYDLTGLDLNMDYEQYYDNVDVTINSQNQKPYSVKFEKPLIVKAKKLIKV
jgi:V8-like Glu-specific endopeptidase